MKGGHTCRRAVSVLSDQVVVRSKEVCITLLLAGLAVPVQSDRAQHGPSGHSGQEHFETSCATTAQPAFHRGLAALHAFAFDAAIDRFHEALAKDPDCAIAQWGIALGLWGSPFGGGHTAADVQDGIVAIQKARLLRHQTERERDYIDAAAQLYTEAYTTDARTRQLAFEKAMAALVRKYPADGEAAIFYARTLIATQLPSDRSYGNLIKAASVLERLFGEHPTHPGVAHYLIHSYDVPEFADRALEAARRYAGMAPPEPHALHMPSHTFTRLGYWQESIASNKASAKAARRLESFGELLHAYDYLTYAYLQSGRDNAAGRIVKETSAGAAMFETSGIGGAAGPYAIAAIPARYALERGRWAEAAGLDVRPTNVPYAEAITRFARALGTVRAGADLGAAYSEIARLRLLSDVLRRMENHYWAEQVEIQIDAASAWVALSEGKEAEALQRMRRAADVEDMSEKAALTPGPIAPSRELLAEMLLEADRSSEALEEFEASARKNPNRFRSIYGAAVAAERVGDNRKALGYYSQLSTVCKEAEAPGRPELARARKVLSGAKKAS